MTGCNDSSWLDDRHPSSRQRVTVAATLKTCTLPFGGEESALGKYLSSREPGLPAMDQGVATLPPKIADFRTSVISVLTNQSMHGATV